MSEPQPDEILIVTTTVGDEAAARALARALVEERLAACAQVEPIVSVYRWEGRLCEAGEWRVSAKTDPERAGAIEFAFRRLHPYQLPQFIAQRAAASAAYAAWVRAEVA